MRILHCCLSCFYIENYNYQENVLPRQNVMDGHQVMILASTEIFKDNKKMGYTTPQEYVNRDGIQVVRVPYRKIISEGISHKFRAYKGVYPIIEAFAPDVIMFHGMGAWELLTIKKYVKKHKIKLFIDNHANFYNSAQGAISQKVLHGMFYKGIIKRVLPYTQKVFCVGFREMEFARELYEVPEEKLEHYPLGGNILTNDEYSVKCERVRTSLGIQKDELIFLHSGKMDKLKMTDQLVEEFEKIENPQWHLLIVGSFLDDIKGAVQKVLLRDERIRYLGWKSAEELIELLCAADVYLQPGSPSATMQNAMCCRCAVMTQPIQEYTFLLQDYGLYVENREDIGKVLRCISQNEIDVYQYKEKTLEQAKKKLDYKMLAAEIYK